MACSNMDGKDVVIEYTLAELLLDMANTPGGSRRDTSRERRNVEYPSAKVRQDEKPNREEYY